MPVSPKIQIAELPVRIHARDGYGLQGVHFAPEMPAGELPVVVFNAGAGIAADRYRNFARFLAGNGVPVLTYDYRGVGASRPARLRGFVATLEDWAEYDCAAAIDWMAARHAGRRMIGIGHSVGSLLFGGAPNSARLSRLLMLAPHTGYYGDYRREYRLPMALLWHGLMPLLTAVVGYFPGSRLGLGEDIPKAVAMEWARRRKPVFELHASTPPENRMRLLVTRLSRMTLDTLMVTFTDDGFATEAAAARVRGLLPSLRVEHRLMTPAQAGIERLGHFGFFRRKAASLWPEILRELQTSPGPAFAD